MATTNPQNLVEEINSLEKEFKAGNLSSSELTELLEDIKQTKVIQVAADDLALKTQLNTMIDCLIAVSSAI
jgi:hypothetical protein